MSRALPIAVMGIVDKLLPQVFLDVEIAGRNAGRLVFELFSDHLPITAENFRCLCTGETGLGYYLRPRWYKNAPFHRIIPGFMCQGGDFNKGTGYGGESIYGQYFKNENFLYKHSRKGVLSMASTKLKDTNNSQFFITFVPCEWLDGKQVVFGHLISGEETLDEMEKQGTAGGSTKMPVKIWNCGQLHLPSTEDSPMEDSISTHTVNLVNSKGQHIDAAGRHIRKSHNTPEHRLPSESFASILRPEMNLQELKVKQDLDPITQFNLSRMKW